MKSALITGITGQDGSYLASFLLEKGYKVYGVYRRLSTPNFWRLQYLDILDKVSLIPGDLVDNASLTEAIEISQPDEVYNLAAQSFVGASFEQPIITGEVTGLGVVRLLEAIRDTGKEIKFYQASSSEMFGDGHSQPLDEKFPFSPSSPYAAAKLYAYWITKQYRVGYDIFACNGIMFNHESPIRGLEFVTRKISNAVAKIHVGEEKELRLGNIDSKRDWGYSPEYVKAMWKMLQHEEADDFVIATGESHSVKEFAAKAFEVVGLNWEDYVKVDKSLLRAIDVNYLQGDCSKAKEVIGFETEVKLDKLVEIMVKEDLKRWERHLKGESFPWDASAYPETMNILHRRPKG